MKSNNDLEEPNINSEANKCHSNNNNKRRQNINNQYNFYYDYSNNDLIADDENNCSVALSNTNNVEEWNWNFNEIDYDFDFEMNNEEMFELDSSSYFKVSRKILFNFEFYLVVY